MEEGNLTATQVASVLGLPGGIDPLTFNPFADGVSVEDALAVEKASHQIMSVVNAFASAGEGAGATEAAAYTAALNSIVEVVKAKAAVGDSLDLTDTADMALIKTQAQTEMAATSGVNTTAFDALADDTATAIKNVNTKIATVADLTSDASKNIFSTTQVLADQVKTAAATEVISAGSGSSSITFTDSNVVNTAASNKAPTNIALSSSAISEAASSLVIGTLTTTDSDQTVGVKPTYALAELAGSDHAAFSINQATGELSLKQQPDYETKTSYSVTVLSTDDGGKTLSKSFTIGVTDANEAPTVANSIADQTIAEDSALNFQFNSNVFADVDAGDSFTYTATLSDGSALPSWLAFSAATRSFSGTPLNANVGVIAVKVTARDSGSAAITDTFNITVTNTNDDPTGAVIISGTASQGEVLTAGSTLVDTDGLGTLSYQWSEDGVAISEATSSTLTLGQSQVGKAITVAVSYTDGGSTLETVSSAATSAVTNTNDEPTGAVIISGTATQGEVLTAGSTLVDADGLGTLSYQWSEDGVAISGATSSTLTLGQSQVGKAITVAVSYTDGKGNAETQASSATSSVVNINDEPTGAVTISGTATQGQVLTAVPALADADGLGTLSYQWSEDGVAISEATSSTLTLGQSQVGKAITVAVSYTDGGDKVETKTSSVTSAVKNINDDPILTVPTGGSATEDGKTSTITGNLVGADPDGDVLTYLVPNLAAVNGSFSVAGTYGTLVLDASTGAYTYTLNNSAAAVQALGASSSETETFSVQVTDGSNTPTAQNLSFTIKGANDAPTLTVPTGGSVTEDAVASTITGSLTSSDPENATLTYLMPGKTAVEGSYSVTGTYGTLVLNASTGAYTYTLDNSATAVQALGASSSETETFSVQVTDGSNTPTAQNLSFTIKGANDVPEALSLSSTVVGNNETGPVVGELNSTDVEGQEVSYTLGGADEAVFELDGTSLKFKDSAITDNSIKNTYNLTVTATDSEAGTLSKAFEIIVTDVDSKPFVQEFKTSAKDGSYNQFSDDILITAIMSEEVSVNSTFTARLNNDVSLTFNYVENSGNELQATYEILEGNDIDDLSIISYNPGSVVDLSELKMSASSKEFSLGKIDIDTTAPTATVSQGTAAKFTIEADGSGTLVITGANFSSIADVNTDVKSILDWSKVIWDVNGTGSGGGADLTLSSANISSAVLTDEATITVKLTNETITTLQSSASFGGTTEGGEVSDALDIAAGFLKDVAGNQASQAATSVTIAPTDAIPGAIAKVELVATNGVVSGDKTYLNVSSQGEGDSLRLSVDFDSVLLPDSSMLVTFNNGGTATLSRDESDQSLLVGSYTVSSSDNDKAALAVQSITSNDTADIYGNVTSNANLITALDVELAKITVDTTAPTATVSQGTAAKFTIEADGSGTLVITGANFSSIADVNTDVKSILDWSKVTWDVNGTGSGGGADLTLSSANIVSAVLTDASTINVVLTDDTIATLQSSASFGGTTEGGEVSDALDIAAGFLKDVAGNQASQAATSVTIAPTDAIPGAIAKVELVATNGVVSGDKTYLNVSSQGEGDSLRLSVDFDSVLLPDSSMLVTLNNGGTATLSRDESDTSLLVGDYTVSSSDDDEAALAVQNITSNDTADIYGNVTSNANLITALDVELAKITVDTTAPTATVSQGTAAKFTIEADGSGTLVITGANFSSIADVNTDVKSILDWSKVTWDVNGTGSGGGADLTLSSANIVSAVLTDASTINVVLTDDTIATLQSSASFGGTTEGGEVSDALDIAAGFLKDVAGNQASQAATSVTIAPTDAIPGAIAKVELVATNGVVSGDKTYLNVSSQGEGDSLRLSVDFDSVLLPDSSMLVTFNNGGTATLSRDESDQSLLVGSYTVSSSDNDKAALAVQSITSNDTADIYGNVISNDNVIAALNLELTKVTVDTTAPKVLALRYTETNENTGLLEFIFNEKLSNNDTVGDHLKSLSYTASTYNIPDTEKTQIYEFNNLLRDSDFANGEGTLLDIGSISLIDIAGNEFTYDDETSAFELIIL